MPTTRFQSPLWSHPDPIIKTEAERKARGWNGALRDAFMLDTSAGQLTMLGATAAAFDIPVNPLRRPVVKGYSPFDEDLTGYERHYDEFTKSTSPQETMLIKQMIDNNTDLRENLEYYGGMRFAAGVIDPINLVPIPFGMGRGLFNGFKHAVKIGSPIVGGTELVRHLIDPTSTNEETAFAMLGGTLFIGLMGGAVGAMPKSRLTVMDALNKMVPAPGTTAMFGGVPWHMGSTKGVFKGVMDSLRSTAAKGEPLSKNIDPERIKIKDNLSGAEDEVKLVEIHVDGENVMQAAIRGGDTLQMLSIEVPERMRGQGIGTAVYKAAIQYAEDHKLRFISDTEVSAAAQRRYDALKDEGYNVEKIDDTLINVDEEGTMTSSRPIYEVKRLVDPDQVKIPDHVRYRLDDLERSGAVLQKQLNTWDELIATTKEKLKTAKGSWVTRRKNELEALLKERNKTDYALRRNRSSFKDENIMVAQMLDQQTIKDWDLLPTGYNKILGKTDQFPWWTLMKTPFRDFAPEIAVKFQVFALRMAQTPGLHNIGNRVGASTGPSVEALAKEYTGQMLGAARKADALYRKYAGHGESSSQMKQYTIDSAQRVRGAVNRALGGEKITTTSDGKLTIEEFENQITVAISKGGTHTIPEVAEAASEYARVLNSIGEEGKRLEVFASQQVLARRIERKFDELYEHDSKAGPREKQSPENLKAADEIELEIMELEELMEAYKAAKHPNYIHRMWLAHEVRAKEVKLKEYLTQVFEDDPKFIKLDEDGRRIPENPDVVAGRVNEAYASILKDAEAGNDLEFMPKGSSKVDWLNARLDYLARNPDGLPPKTVQTQVKIIERKIESIMNGHPTGATGPLIARRLDLDDAYLVELGVIEGNVKSWMHHYVARTAPVIETARTFGDAKAEKYMKKLLRESREIIKKEPDPKKRAKMLKELERGHTAMIELRDIVHGVYQIPDDPSAITPRVLRALRNFNILGSMGRSVFMAFGDVGNIVVSQGFARSLGHAVEHFASGIKDGNIKMMRDEVDLAGSTSEVILGMRYHQMTDAGRTFGTTTQLERTLASASQRFFLHNLLGPWTDMARRFSGGMLQSRIIENSRLWKLGTLADDQIEIMTSLGINRKQAIQFADEWEAAGGLKHKSMFIAGTQNWTSEQAIRTFRAAMNTEIDRMVPTPGAVDKPKALLKSDWWKIVGQYRGFSIAATHRIMGAGLHTKGAQKYSGIASMIGIAMIVDSLKRPDYIQMPVEEQLLRAVELSGVTGIILDLNDTIERASAGSIGLRPALSMDIRERNPNWANRMGTIGAVPNSWLTLMYGLTSDDAETNDLARAVRYMIPYNNLLWWNEAFNRAQRSTVDFIEDREDD